MTAAEVLLGAVTLQRLAELVLARRNTTKLLARGAHEIGAAHYPLIVVLHVAWLGSLWVFSYGQPINMLALACYLLLQALRGWVMWTLGTRWTTRVNSPETTFRGSRANWAPVDLLTQATRPWNGPANDSMSILTGLPGSTPGRRSSSRFAST